MKTILATLLLSTSLYSGGFFSVGHKNVGITIGSDNSFGNSYTVLGGNINYFIMDNLSVGAAYQAYLGGEPDISQITIPVTYYIPLESAYRPYVGAFYNQTFIDKPYEDFNIYGGRIGITLLTSPSSFISAGWVQEFSNSSNNIDTRGYPEISGGLSF